MAQTWTFFKNHFQVFTVKCINYILAHRGKSSLVRDNFQPCLVSHNKKVGTFGAIL